MLPAPSAPGLVLTLSRTYRPVGDSILWIKDSNPKQKTNEIMKPEKKLVTIIVEGTPHEWPKEEISYEQVVTLEVPDYAQHPEINYSVKYKRGQGNKPEGILLKGESVKVKEGMVFSVSETGQS
jgi:hypothetical protein